MQEKERSNGTDARKLSLSICIRLRSFSKAFSVEKRNQRCDSFNDNDFWNNRLAFTFLNGSPEPLFYFSFLTTFNLYVLST